MLWHHKLFLTKFGLTELFSTLTHGSEICTVQLKAERFFQLWSGCSFSENVKNYGRNSWQKQKSEGKSWFVLYKRGGWICQGWICRKQTGRTPVIKSRNQRYMASPSITNHCCTESPTFSYRPIYQHPLWCSGANVFVIATSWSHTALLVWLLVEN